MKKLISTIAITLSVIFILMPTAFAFAANEQANEYEKQQRIDEIFTKLNDLASEKIVQQETAKFYSLANEYVANNNIHANKSALEEELFSLGIKKIDANNSSDLDRFKEITGESIMREYDAVNNTRAMPFDDLDELINDVMEKYEVYQYEGYRTVNGVSYPYAYFRVIDRGNGNLFITSLRGDLIGNESMVVRDFLLLQFEMAFDLSKVFGVQGAAIQWGLSSVFGLINSLEQNTMLQANSDSLYYCTIASVTEMTIYYIYIATYGIWEICGSRASNVSVKRVDISSFNYNGDPRIVVGDEKSYTFSTGKSWYWYVDNHINLNRVPTHHTIGEITVRGLNSNRRYTFSPKYYKSFVGLLL